MAQMHWNAEKKGSILLFARGRSITEASKYMIKVVATPTNALRAQPAVKWCTNAKYKANLSPT